MGYLRALVVAHGDNGSGVGNEYLLKRWIPEASDRIAFIKTGQAFVFGLPGVAAVVGSEYAVVYRNDIDGTVPASNGDRIKLDAATNFAVAPGGAVVEGEVKAGVTYGVKTDAVALEQIDAPDDLGAEDMFPLGAGILGAVGEPDREQEWGGLG